MRTVRSGEKGRKRAMGINGAGRVSVVIPLYNHEKFIEEAVASVLAQGKVLAELIVIDDGSKDRSVAIMRRLELLDTRIEFLVQENRGAHATINRGLAGASGEFVTILNSDDAFEPGRFDALVHALDIDDGSDLAASSIAFMNDASQPIGNPWFDEALGGYKRSHDLGLSLVDANFLMTTSNFFMRRSLLDRIGDFAPLRYAHDLEFALRFAAEGGGLAFVDKPLMRYRFHGSNTISENHQNVRFEWAVCAARFIQLLWSRKCSADWPRLRLLREILDRHELTPMTDLCLLYLSRQPSADLDENGILQDADFRDFALRLTA